MDEISLLRRSRNDIPERAPADVARGRAALFAQIEAESPVALFSHLGDDTTFTPLPARRKRRRRAAWAGFSALGATALICTLVATNVLGVPGWHGGADPAAAAALDSAAIAALAVSDPVVGSGQYMVVETDARYIFAGDFYRDEQGDIVGGGDSTYFLETEHSELYVPANQEDDWLWLRCARTPAETFGPESEALAKVMSEEMGNAAHSLQRIPGGVMYGGDELGGYREGPDLQRNFGDLPRDPRQLLDRIRQIEGSAGQSRDGQALVWIADMLRYGVVPAEFRAALYQAAAEIPGVTITEEQATLNGRTGIAIGRTETVSGFRQDLIIDPATGQFIGERQVTLTGYEGVPAGTVEASTAVTSTVVDSAPTDVSRCGPTG